MNNEIGVVNCLVEEYVKDLYRIGLIAFLVPMVLILRGVILAIRGQQIDFENYNATIGTNALTLVGFLIMLYISIKYYYREGRRGKT